MTAGCFTLNIRPDWPSYPPTALTHDQSSRSIGPFVFLEKQTTLGTCARGRRLRARTLVACEDACALSKINPTLFILAPFAGDASVHQSFQPLISLTHSGYPRLQSSRSRPHKHPNPRVSEAACRLFSLKNKRHLALAREGAGCVRGRWLRARTLVACEDACACPR